MKLIAFDLATQTGIAIGDTEGRPVGQSENLGEAGKPHGIRFTYALRMATNLILEQQPDWIAIEEPIAGGVKGDENRLKMLMGLRASIYIAAELRKIRVVEYPVQTIRKHFIGYGMLKSADAKSRTIARCMRLGWNPANHNEADAMAVWDLARARLTRSSTLPANGLFDHGYPDCGARPT